MIRFENVTKRFRGTAKPALHDIDFEVTRGEFLFLVGPSGSGKSSCLRLILREELLPLAVGLAGGIVAARALAHVVTSIVFGVSPTDPMTIAVAAALLFAAAVLACAVPAQRAAAIDPLTALRSK